jgi:hypothetical protein
MQTLRSFFENESWQRKALDGFFDAWKELGRSTTSY